MHGMKLLVLVAFALGAAVASKPFAAQKQFDQPLIDFHYVNHEVILAITRDGKLWKSVDAGATWAEENLPKTSRGAVANRPIYVSDNKYVFVHGNTASNWWSTDGGRTFYEDVAPAHLENIEIHPRQPTYALGFSGSQTAYVTRNAGKSWTKVFTTALEASFGDADVYHISKNRVYGVAHEDWTNFKLVSTEDLGSSFQTLQSNTFTAVFLDHQIFSLAYADDWGDIYLRVSPDVGMDVKTFYRAEFPWGEELETKNLYAILDDSTSAVFMAINHQNSDSRYGHLYVSEPMGVQYVMTLPFIVHSQTNFDFMRVLSLPGIYIANSLTNHDEPNSVAPLIKSYISFDNGGTWDSLTPPAKDRKNKAWGCNTGSDCSLHLHGWRSYLQAQQFGPFYSAASALGLVIGNGNVGEYLSYEPAEASTFISNDGGVTFTELFKGATIYEIADHGGVVVWAELGKSVDTIYYTLDFGATVDSLKLSKSIKVWNIVSEDNLNGTSFLVVDSTYTNVFHLEFKDAFDNKVCDMKRDYEEWIPNNPAVKTTDGKKCLMGRQVTWLRRKASSLCHSPPNYDDSKHKSTYICKCTYADYECDFGYYYTKKDSTGKPICNRDDSIKLNDPPLWCKPGRNYNSTKGYRLEAGNGCQDGVDLQPEVKACPSYEIEDPTITDSGGASSHKAGWVAIGILVPVVILIVVAALVALNSEKLRDRIPFMNSLSNLRDGYSRMGQPSTAPGALFDDEEYIIGSLDDKGTHEEEDADGLKNVDLNATTTVVADDEFDPRK